MSNSCMCCSLVISGGLWVFTQVHPHGTCVPCFIKQFVNFDAKMFSFLWNILPKDNPAPSFYNYLVQCEILRGAIEFSVTVVQGIEDGPWFPQSVIIFALVRSL